MHKEHVEKINQKCEKMAWMSEGTGTHECIPKLVIENWVSNPPVCPEQSRHFRNKYEMVEEPNSSSKIGISVKFFSTITGNLV